MLKFNLIRQLNFHFNSIIIITDPLKVYYPFSYL